MLLFVQKTLILFTSVWYSCDSTLQLWDKVVKIGSGRVDTLLLRIAPLTNLKSLCVRSSAIFENTSVLLLFQLISSCTPNAWVTKFKALKKYAVDSLCGHILRYI